MPPKSKGPHLVLRAGKWYVAWIDGHGRSKRKSTGSRDRAVAELVLAEVLANPERPAGDGPTVSDTLVSYRTGHHFQGKGGETADYAIARLREAFGDRLVSSLTRSEIAGYYKTGRPVAATTKARELTVLRAAFSHAIKEKVIEAAPVVTVIAPEQPRDRWLTKKEAGKLIAAAEPHIALFIQLALATAARPGALLDLTWDRVDLKRGRIDLQPLSRARTSKRRPVVPIPPELIQRLRKQRISGKSTHVIEYRGEPIGRIIKGFAATAERAGLRDVIPYTLRHTAATWMAQAGVSIMMIAGMLGQSIQRTTERYIKHHPDYMADAMEALRLDVPRQLARDPRRKGAKLHESRGRKRVKSRR